MAPPWNRFGKRIHFLKVKPFFSLIIMFEKKNGASDQSGTICQNGSTVEPFSTLHWEKNGATLEGGTKMAPP